MVKKKKKKKICCIYFTTIKKSNKTQKTPNKLKSGFKVPLKGTTVFLESFSLKAVFGIRLPDTSLLGVQRPAPWTMASPLAGIRKNS